MTELLKSSLTDSSTDLLTRYSFDLHGHSVEQLIAQWTSLYQAHWIRQAVIEALYQGRYKAISVEQILAAWHRRGQPICHFSREFERIICSSPLKEIRKVEFASTAAGEPVRETILGAGIAYPPLRISPSMPIRPIGTVDPAPPARSEEPAAVEQPKPGFEPLFQAPAEPLTAAVVSESTTEPPESASVEPATPDPIQADIPPEPATPDLPDFSIPMATSSLPEADPEPEIPNLGPLDHPSVLEVLQQQQAMILPDSSKPPIHRFVPLEETSEFYVKLRAVAQGVQSGSDSN